MLIVELKSRIEKYLEGDEDAVPSIFEAILSRKLSGKHDQSDDELMEELQIRTKTSDRDANEEDEFDSGSDSWTHHPYTICIVWSMYFCT